MDEPLEIPEGAKKIYYATVIGYILKPNKGKNKGFYRQSFKYEMIYKENAEKDKGSYFIECLEREMNLKKIKNGTYKITDINKIKYLSFSVPSSEGVKISVDRNDSNKNWYDNI